MHTDFNLAGHEITGSQGKLLVFSVAQAVQFIKSSTADHDQAELDDKYPFINLGVDLIGRFLQVKPGLASAHVYVPFKKDTDPLQLVDAVGEQALNTISLFETSEFNADTGRLLLESLELAREDVTDDLIQNAIRSRDAKDMMKLAQKNGTIIEPVEVRDPRIAQDLNKGIIPGTSGFHAESEDSNRIRMFLPQIDGRKALSPITAVAVLTHELRHAGWHNLDSIINSRPPCVSLKDSPEKLDSARLMRTKLIEADASSPY